MEQSGADLLTVRTHDNVAVGFPTAGLASRFWAFLLDTILYIPIGIVIALGVGALLDALAPAGSTLDNAIGGYFTAVATGLTVLIGYAAYFILAEGITSGRTPGKRSAGIRVIRRDGSSIGWSEALLRGLLRSPVALMGDLVIGPGLIFATSRRLGDLLAGTVVVRERQPAVTLATAMGPPVYLRLRDAGAPVSGIERLGPRDMSALRTFLSRPDLHPAQRQRVALELARKLGERMELPVDAPERHEHPEHFVERVYMQLAGREAAAQ